MDKANTVLDYMSKVLEHRLNNDKEQLEALIDETSKISVTMDDVVVALDVIVEDLTSIIEYQQELQEHRMRVIVDSLDAVTQARIHKAFDAVEDDLFYDTEGENN